MQMERERERRGRKDRHGGQKDKEGCRERFGNKGRQRHIRKGEEERVSKKERQRKRREKGVKEGKREGTVREKGQ